jgi:hypothetical protein
MMDKMGSTRSLCARNEKPLKILLSNTLGNRPLENIRVDGRILKLI